MRTLLVILALVAVVHAVVSVSSTYALKTVAQIPGGTSTVRLFRNQ